MRIRASIDYWENKYLAYDPEKIVGHLRNYFQHVEVDPIDYSLKELNRMEKIANENVDEPDRSIILSQIHGRNRANGPIFKFNLLIGENKVNGTIQRYSVDFYSENNIGSKSEKKIIEFLKTLNYGQISSNTKSSNFRKQSEENKESWELS